MSRRRALAFYLVLLGLPAAALLLVYSTSVEPQWITVNYLNVGTPRLRMALAGTRIAVVNDLHSFGFNAAELNMLETLEQLDPDWVLVPGDVLPRHGATRRAVDVLHAIPARRGVLVSYGDSDLFAEREELQQELLRTRTMLADERVSVLVDSWEYIQGSGGTVLVAGLNGEFPPRPQALLDALPKDRPVILLAHYPETFHAAAAAGIDLTLSGDTHGGQVELPHALLRLIFGPDKTEFRQGLFQQGRSTLYVNQGIGMSVLPMRFLCRPEITVLDF